MKISQVIIFVSLILIFASCKDSEKKPPVDLKKTKIEESSDIEIPFSDLNGVKTIPVKINGVTMDMIFDTGCSGISLSLNELQTLIKSDKISEEDFIDDTYATIADGSVVRNGQINLKEIQIGGENGITVYNVKASVVLNQMAPVLLGNGVIDEVASVEVDNVNKIIKFKRQ